MHAAAKAAADKAAQEVLAAHEARMEQARQQEREEQEARAREEEQRVQALKKKRRDQLEASIAQAKREAGLAAKVAREMEAAAVKAAKNSGKAAEPNIGQPRGKDVDDDAGREKHKGKQRVGGDPVAGKQIGTAAGQPRAGGDIDNGKGSGTATGKQSDGRAVNDNENVPQEHYDGVPLLTTDPKGTLKAFTALLDEAREEHMPQFALRIAERTFELDRDLQRMENRLHPQILHTNNHIGRLRGYIDRLDGRVQDVERRMGELESRQATFEEETRRRVEKLEDRIDRRVEFIRDEWRDALQWQNSWVVDRLEHYGMRMNRWHTRFSAMEVIVGQPIPDADDFTISLPEHAPETWRARPISETDEGIIQLQTAWWADELREEHRSLYQRAEGSTRRLIRRGKSAEEDEHGEDSDHQDAEEEEGEVGDGELDQHERQDVEMEDDDAPLPEGHHGNGTNVADAVALPPQRSHMLPPRWHQLFPVGDSHRQPPDDPDIADLPPIRFVSNIAGEKTSLPGGNLTTPKTASNSGPLPSRQSTAAATAGPGDPSTQPTSSARDPSAADTNAPLATGAEAPSNATSAPATLPAHDVGSNPAAPSTVAAETATSPPAGVEDVTTLNAPAAAGDAAPAPSPRAQDLPQPTPPAEQAHTEHGQPVPGPLATAPAPELRIIAPTPTGSQELEPSTSATSAVNPAEDVEMEDSIGARPTAAEMAEGTESTDNANDNGKNNVSVAGGNSIFDGKQDPREVDGSAPVDGSAGGATAETTATRAPLPSPPRVVSDGEQNGGPPATDVPRSIFCGRHHPFQRAEEVEERDVGAARHRRVARS